MRRNSNTNKEGKQPRPPPRTAAGGFGLRAVGLKESDDEVRACWAARQVSAVGGGSVGGGSFVLLVLLLSVVLVLTLVVLLLVVAAAKQVFVSCSGRFVAEQSAAARCCLCSGVFPPSYCSPNCYTEVFPHRPRRPS